MEYDEIYHCDKKMHKILLVDSRINPIFPVKVDTQNHLIFSVSPPLPEGMALDPKMCVIAGTPLVSIGKTIFTITARNKSGHSIVKIALAVAGKWEDTPPKEWTKEMVQVWLKEVLKVTEDVRILFADVDVSQLILLLSREAVATLLWQHVCFHLSRLPGKY